MAESYICIGGPRAGQFVQLDGESLGVQSPEAGDIVYRVVKLAGDTRAFRLLALEGMNSDKVIEELISKYRPDLVDQINNCTDLDELEQAALAIRARVQGLADEMETAKPV